jgi:hypothetical protein
MLRGLIQQPLLEATGSPVNQGTASQGQSDNS